MFCPEPSANASTPRSKLLIKVLRGIFLLQTVIMILIFLFQSEFEGIFELMHMIILYCAFHNVNPCYCVVYIFMCMMKLFQIIVWFGLMVQNGFPFFRQDNSLTNGITILNIVSVIFYIGAIFFTFLSYKEFKALEIENENLRLLNDGEERSHDYRVDYGVQPNEELNASRNNERPANNPDAPYFRESGNADLGSRRHDVEQQRALELNNFQNQFNQARQDWTGQRMVPNQEPRQQEYSRDENDFYSFQGHGSHNLNQENNNNNNNNNGIPKVKQENPDDSLNNSRFAVTPIKEDPKYEVAGTRNEAELEVPKKSDDDGRSRVIVNNKVFEAFQGQGIMIGGNNDR